MALTSTGTAQWTSPPRHYDANGTTHAEVGRHNGHGNSGGDEEVDDTVLIHGDSSCALLRFAGSLSSIGPYFLRGQK